MVKKLIVIILAVFAVVEAHQDHQRMNTGNFCQGCRSITSFMSRLNGTKHRADYTEKLEDFCELYYPPSTDFQTGPCPVFVRAIFEFIDKVDPVNHCDQISACNRYPSRIEAKRQGVQVDQNKISFPRNESTDNYRESKIVCEACEMVITQLKDQLMDQKFIDDLHQQVNSLCDYLKVIDQDHLCRTSLEKYLDQAIEFVKELPPHQYCQSISFCGPKDSDSKNDAAANLIRLPQLTDFANFGIETNVRIDDSVVKSIDQSEPASSTYENGPNCAMCKVVVKELFKFLKDNKTEENIREGLDNVCDWIFPKGGQHNSDCREYVDAYSRELLQLLVDETDPDLICTLLDQCGPKKDFYKVIRDEPPKKPKVEVVPQQKRQQVTVGDLISMLDPSVPPQSMRGCIECKLFIKYLQGSLWSPNTLDQTKHWLVENLCESLPTKELKDSCESLVDTYAETFFKAVSENMNPERTCIDLQACNYVQLKSTLVLDNDVPLPTPVMKPANLFTMDTLQGGLFCDQCVETITKIDEYLSNHPVEHDVKVIVEQVCKKLPSESQVNACTLIVTNFGQEIIKAISSMESPKELCAQIELC